MTVTVWPQTNIKGKSTTAGCSVAFCPKDGPVCKTKKRPLPLHLSIINKIGIDI